VYQWAFADVIDMTRIAGVEASASGLFEQQSDFALESDTGKELTCRLHMHFMRYPILRLRLLGRCRISLSFG
jgi:hypothetical protein